MAKITFKNWCKALRSGIFKQGRSELHCTPTNTYCCLGVAAKIVAGVKLIENVVENSGNLCKTTDHSDLDGPLIPWAKKLGITNSLQSKLVDLNDAGDGNNFPAIADYIEKWAKRYKKW